jgi:hypothetical protein
LKIAVIVPNLPPAPCGVYDYARKLAEHWPARADWTLISPGEGSAWPGAQVRKVERDGASLAQQLRDLAPECVGLQFTCFGYAENGVPEWLADGLEAFKHQSKARLAIMFHEFAYDGAPWRRAHWRKPRQTALAARLCSVADGALTGVPQWQHEMQQVSGREVARAVLPSNIDPVEFASHQGPLSLGVFGLPHSRERALHAHHKLLQAIGPCTLRLIGFGLGEGLAAGEKKLLKGLKCVVEACAKSAPAEVSRAMASCHAMLAPCSSEEIWKSGSSMAALAHGCTLVATGTEKLGGPPLLAYEGAGSMKNVLEQLRTSAARECGAAGRNWYEMNSGWPRSVAAWVKAFA